eukprot:CAMPEP_0205944800 /NCGR_PEP_ID=MMETSP1325-20131115/64257_1 /ASSEMBLY_ACC=CAM_ASM_000708 /TAXON_ID=236786 /ORGANISM="Florenciella sp., Strain RCC1007" /LENGTH=51 /DNA_ID=CAMNT_0053315723 /DNA_START=197 /DNA_END=348 /DNA_ORIENTATION=-
MANEPAHAPPPLLPVSVPPLPALLFLLLLALVCATFATSSPLAGGGAPSAV